MSETAEMPLRRRPAMRVTGHVKSFDPLKGWGVVSSSSVNGDIVLYQSVVIQSGCAGLKAGMTLTCDITERPQGFEVVHVVRMSAIAA
jgi:cold shock CspA family protein